MNDAAHRETPDFRLLFEASPALLIVLAPDSQFTIIAASDAYLRATLIRREDVVGRGMFDVFPDNPDDPTATGTASLRASLQRVLRDRRPDAMAIQKYDIRKPASEGGGFEERYWTPTNYPVFAADGTCTCIIHRAEDVTEFVRMSQQRQEQSRLADELRKKSDVFEVEMFQRAREVEEANARLRAANEQVARLYERTRELDALKTQFFANVSHELRTPLALILGPVRRLLSAKGLAAESAFELQVVERNTQLLLKHVNDLLDIAKLDAGALLPHYSQVDVVRLVRFVASHFELLAAERGLQLQLDVPECLPAQLDVARTQRVLLNLLSNAFKFTPESGRITVRAALQGGRVRIRVEDTGPGVPETLRESIFERFRQGEESLTRKVGGTGLGLHIVREFVRLQGGEVSVQAAEGGGAAFVVELPATAPAGVPVSDAQAETADASVVEMEMEMLALEAAVPANPGAAEAQGGLPGAAHVLVVDDNRDMNEFVARSLAGGYRVSRALDGLEALRLAREDLPDLVLTDLMLPGMSGEELLLKLRADPMFDEVPVVLLTARADDAMRVRLLQVGAQDYIAKPFNPDELLARIARLVEVRRRRLQTERESVAKLHAHLGRLSLLQQITRAIGDRQDLPSICQVVLRTLEDRMPLDFACMGEYVEAQNQLVVTGLGLKGAELALGAALGNADHINLGAEGLDRCLKGEVVYDPDLSTISSPFARRLTAAGLRSMVAVPVRLESQTFGVLVAARREARSFSSSECEFLAQLAEHVALAANNLKLYSALHTAYEDLRSTQQSAMQQERLRALGQMASGIAHDINNSITPAALYLDALLEKGDTLPPGVVDRLQTIQRAVHDVAATVSRMREFYRQRETQQSFAPVQLNELVRQVVDLTRARWSDMPLQRGIAIDLRTELATRLPSIMGVDHELREALINLVFNAVDAMPKGGTLIVRTRQDEDGRVVVEVSDTGVGMDEEARRRCLEPFYTTKGERGTGLGLAMVFGAAQRHGADIDIDSAIGVGTTIRLTFAEAAQQGVPAPQPQALKPRPRRILIIDDDPVLLRSLHDALAIDGHSVVMANGGEEGIERFRAALQGGQPCDVVFTDLGMPYVDGRQVAATVKALSPATPVIMLTGWGQHMHEDGEAPLHVDQLLGKPPRLRDLRAALVKLSG